MQRILIGDRAAQSLVPAMSPSVKEAFVSCEVLQIGSVQRTTQHLWQQLCLASAEGWRTLCVCHATLDSTQSMLNAV